MRQAMWGDVALTEAEVISQFAQVIAGNVLFDFGGGNSVQLNGINTLIGLENYFEIF